MTVLSEKHSEDEDCSLRYNNHHRRFEYLNPKGRKFGFPKYRATIVRYY